MIRTNIINGNKLFVKDTLYQWDLNQVLEIRGLSLPSVPEIHFTNTSMDRAIVRKATMDDAGVIRADIPNSLLQKAYKVIAYVCIDNGDSFESLYTLEIPVKARNKPADYTLEHDEEVYSFNALEKKVDNAIAEMTAKCDETISSVNNGYENVDKKIGVLTTLKTGVMSNVVNAINWLVDQFNDLTGNLKPIAFSGDYNDLLNKPSMSSTPGTFIVDSELSADSTNAIQNKAVKAEFDKLRTMYQRPSQLGISSTNRTAKLIDIINAMDAKSHVTFWISDGGGNHENSQYLGVYNEILEGIKLKHPEVTEIYGDVEICKTDGTTEVTVYEYQNTSRVFMNRYTTINGFGWRGWEKVTTSSDFDKLKTMYRYPWDFGCNVDDTTLTLETMFDAMDDRSEVTFWINSTSSYVSIYNQVLEGITEAGYTGSVAHGLVTIRRTAKTATIRWEFYNETTHVYEARYTIENRPTWGKWEKIVTRSDFNNLLKTTVHTELLSANPGGGTISEIYLIQDSVFADKTYIPVAITSISIDQGKCVLEGFGIKPNGTNGYSLFVNCYNPRSESVEFYLEAIILWAKAPMLTS